MSRRRPALFWSGSRTLVLASASPRRVTLLRQVGADFVVVDPGPDRPWPGEAEPRHGVRALALHKAGRVSARRPGAVVIGADTVVVLRGTRLGKPGTPGEAASMLSRLHGRTHEVWTGIAVVGGGEQRTAAECTRVSFARLHVDEINAYVASGEPLDKAGAYGIQGLAGQFVRRIEGDYANVVGLPLARLRAVLAEFA
ncbi:MAG: septum formation protein Maf [Candidatus Eisenbacteria bacterium]|uniref:dTTP/UTP pyrophosphatase n=1 Tax=Eiseniibacteriota bacterium TaxID=2212470 RepID=A0A538U897_UNCEI|nr:MAG: septum formation protein Maf [Candidatus Eisenbacteria bacterium]